MWICENWKDYELIDTSHGEKLERWGRFTLIRPDPQVIWETEREHPLWREADAAYRRSRTGGGAWSENRLPEKWTVGYGDLRFCIRPMGFKHTGLFPEQAVNWDWFSRLIREAGRPIKVLNLFAYTGGATVAAAKAGASVCHVDAAKGMVAAAKENAVLSGLADAPIRYIVDDCRKFVEREIRRGNRYDGIIMDPPSYGRGPTGEVWKIEEHIDELVSLVSGVFSEKPLFFLLNSYTTGLSASAMKYITALRIGNRFGGRTEADEIGLPVSHTGLVLPCGSSVRHTFEET
ncbi:MAG: class I SAM-dependent methyltransferase [Clostridia bacterium]|nr:class I SAM-dependent methyltransferase [Clostridia bacterium]